MDHVLVYNVPSAATGALRLTLDMSQLGSAGEEGLPISIDEVAGFGD
ncbi:MAG: hypothetical protein RIG82_05805 [Phycisphaeraceae bacterium]